MPNYGLLALLAQQGRREDNAAMGGQVAHISQQDAQILRALGGTGTTNPATGLPEYFNAGLAGQGFGPGGASFSGFGPGGGTAASFGSFGKGTGGTASGVTGVGKGSSGVGSGLAGASLGLGDGDGDGGSPTTVNWSEWGPTTRMQAPLAPTSPSAPVAPEASKMFTKLGESITNATKGPFGPITGKLAGFLATTLGLALANTGGYTSAGSPGGVIPDSKPNLLPLADVIAAAPKPAEGEQFILESDPTALEEAELQRLALLELLPNIEGLTPEVASLLQRFREQELALGSTA
jgi:hypothetical protein